MLSAAQLGRIETAIYEVAAERFGAEARRQSLIVDAVRSLSERYNRQRAGARGGGRGAGREAELDLLAQLCFFTPADLPKAAHLMGELAAAGLPGSGDLRLLDVGAGCGAQSIGILGYLAAAGAAKGRKVELDAIDLDAGALELMRRLVGRLEPWLSERGISVRLRTECAELRQRIAARPERPYDLIVAGSVLAEIPAKDHAGLGGGLLDLLRPDEGRGLCGALLLIEPALRETARALHGLRDQLLQQGRAWVLGPCTRQGPCPSLEQPTDWCHELRIWEPPPRLRALTHASGLRRRDLKWAYVTLLPRPRDGSLPAPAADRGSGRLRVVSSVIRTKGKRELFVCGEPGRVRLMRLDRHASGDNAALPKLRRGTLVRLERPGETKGGSLRVLEQTRVLATDAFDPDDQRGR